MNLLDRSGRRIDAHQFKILQFFSGNYQESRRFKSRGDLSAR